MDGLRFMAFAAIFLYHADLVQFWFASYSVHIFFVLSGFLITGILLDQGHAPAGKVLASFYARRCLRIFPAYYLLITILFFFGCLPYAPWNYTYTFNIKLFQLSAAGELGPILQNWKSWGIHLWTLCVEEQYYLVYPVLFLFVPARLRAALLAVLAAATFAFSHAVPVFFPESYFGVLLPVAGEYIVWGGIAAYAHRKIPLRKGMAGAMIGASCLLILLLLIAGGKPDDIAPQFRPGPLQTLYAIAFSLFMWGLWADDRSVFARVLAFRPFAYLGKISYGLYLAHLAMWPVRDFLVSKISVLAAVPEALAVFLLTVMTAALSWHFFEQPLNNLKRFFPYPARAANAC